MAVETIFGPPPLLPGEDTSAYEALLARVSADVKPKDIIEEIWVRDIVDITWDTFRLRKIEGGPASRGVADALSNRLKAMADHPDYGPTEGLNIREYNNSLCHTFAYRWITNDPEVVAWVSELEANKVNFDK